MKYVANWRIVIQMLSISGRSVIRVSLLDDGPIPAAEQNTLTGMGGGYEIIIGFWRMAAVM